MGKATMIRRSPRFDSIMGCSLNMFAGTLKAGEG